MAASDSIEFHAIAAMCDENRGIGKNNQLPWSVPDDYNYFLRVVRTTRDRSKVNAMIMGRLTWESTPIDHRPILPGITVILSSKLTKSDIQMNQDADPNSVFVIKTVQEAVDFIRTNFGDKVERIYCLGGSEIYRESIGNKDFKRFYLTRIYGSFECDVFLQPANFLDMFRKLPSEQLVGEEKLFGCRYNADLVEASNGIKYKFEVYEKIEN